MQSSNSSNMHDLFYRLRTVVAGSASLESGGSQTVGRDRVPRQRGRGERSANGQPCSPALNICSTCQQHFGSVRGLRQHTLQKHGQKRTADIHQRHGRLPIVERFPVDGEYK